jgi:hypothetical protein
MLKLIDHIVRISARRDRTEINTAMVEAMLDIFGPRSLRIYRCFSSGPKTVVFACAGFGTEAAFHTMPICQNASSAGRSPGSLATPGPEEGSIVLDILPDGAIAWYSQSVRWIN